VAKHIVGPVESIPPGAHRHVEVGGRGIAIFNVAGCFYGLRDVCPHQGARLSGGVVVESVEADEPGRYRVDKGRPFVRCPWHGWEYELATGRSWFDPAHNRVKNYDVSVAQGGELLERTPGPYTAETVQISIEADYIVVEM
jgi:3-phenylpropionate/trans-cinnamate dioxygenase ferredoxin subunit